MSHVSSDPSLRQRGQGRETFVDHLALFVGYLGIYAGFVLIQSTLPDPKHAGTGFLMMVCSIPFLIGFIPTWWLSRYVSVGRTGWIRHGLIGVVSGFVVLGIAVLLVAGGVV